MMKRLSRRDKKVLWIGGGFTVVTLLVVYVFLPFYESVSDVEDQLSSKQEMLGRSVRVIQNEGLYLAQLQQLENELSRLREQLLEARDPVLAQNQLETIVRNVADQSGVTISRSTPLQEKSVGERYSKVTLQINVQSGMAELTEFLYAVSVHPKFLHIEDFYMNAFRVRENVRLQPRMNVSGFMFSDSAIREEGK